MRWGRKSCPNNGVPRILSESLAIIDHYGEIA